MASIENKKFTTQSGTIVTIRNAHPSDAQRLIDINTNIISEIYFMMREPEEALYTLSGEITKIKNHAEGSGSLYLVSEVDDDVVGYIDFQNGFLKRTAHAGGFSIYIDKKWRGQGIGKLLLENLIVWAEKNPLIEKITLAVFSTNQRAQGLYKKLGFTEEGRCPRDMKMKDGTYMDSVLMYKFVQ